MAVGDSQYRTGYTKGIKGMVLEVLSADGSAVTPTPTRYGIKTPQELSYEFEVIEGDESQLRGGDIILVNVKEKDIIVSANLSTTNAKLDLECVYHIAGGTLTEEEIETVTYNTGWQFPTIAEQYSKVPFKLEVYIQNFNASGQQDSYLLINFYYVNGYLSSVTHSDQEWAIPELELKAEENSAQSKSIMDYDWVDTLPSELTA